VRGNESRLGQVFLNLLVNAAQAIPEGHADINEIRVVVRLDGEERAVVEISDTGCGIPDEIARQLFVPFVTTKPVGVGTGLGLTICQRIITALGGEIGYERRDGGGTTFCVTLPVDNTASAPRETGAPLVRQTLHSGRIVVIDDDVSIATLIKRLLQRDHEVITFTNASDALTLLEHDRTVDLILCDLMMPVVNGCEFYARLQASAPELAERTVFLTGGAFTEETRAFLDRVPNRNVAKPFETSALRALVSERVQKL
jgi:CheY-like chemotaxis protein